MANCPFKLKINKITRVKPGDPPEYIAIRPPLQAGDRFTISVDPKLGPGCTFNVRIDGQDVAPSGQAGDFKLNRLGGDGEADFEALHDKPVEIDKHHSAMLREESLWSELPLLHH